MNALNQAEVQEFFAKVGITAADPHLNIGRQLTYRTSPRRIIVIHFGPADSLDYIARVVSTVLSSQDSWLLIPRYGPTSKLALSTAFPKAEALSFDVADRGQLCNYLCTRDMNIGSVSSDLYVVSGDGNVIITWDHHTQAEGLRIDLCDVRESSKLLTEMNNMGAEMEVFYSDG